jgi:hypothetical protein
VGEVRLRRKLLAVRDQAQVDRLGQSRGDLLGATGRGKGRDQG